MSIEHQVRPRRVVPWVDVIDHRIPELAVLDVVQHFGDGRELFCRCNLTQLCASVFHTGCSGSDTAADDSEAGEVRLLTVSSIDPQLGPKLGPFCAHSPSDRDSLARFCQFTRHLFVIRLSRSGKMAPLGFALRSQF